MSWDALRRQALEQESARQARSGGGKRFMPWSADTFQIDVDDEGALRFLDPGERGPYGRLYHFTNHGPRTCTAEDHRFDGKCVYCWKYQKEKDKGTDSRLYQRFDRVLEVIDFRYFHAIDDPDDEKKYLLVRCKSDDAIPKRNRCKYCLSEDPNTSKRIFGGHKVWELNNTAWNQIWGLSEKVARTCIHYDKEDGLCLDEIYPVAYNCSACGAEQISEKAITEADEAELKKFVSKKQECVDIKDAQGNVIVEGCGETMILTEITICGSGDHDPVHALIFHKKLPLTCTGQKKSRKIGGKTKEYMQRNYNFEVGGDFTTVAQDLAEYGFNDEEIEKLCEPWDLNKRYAPERVDRDEFESDEDYVQAVFAKQAESLGLESVPFKTNKTSRSTPFNAGFQR